MLQTLPRYVIFTGIIFVLTVLGFAVSYFVGAPRHSVGLAVPIQLTDSMSCTVVYRPDISKEYFFTLEVDLPPDSGGIQEMLDSWDKPFRQVRIRATIQNRGEFVPKVIETYERFSPNYTGVGGGKAIVSVPGNRPIFLRSSRVYDCSFNFMNVPSKLWGLSANFRLAESSADAFDEDLGWYIRTLFGKVIVLLSGIPFLFALVFWRIRRKLQVRQTSG